MADDRGDRPALRPRRRRTDIDPNAPTPRVPVERRRTRSLRTAPELAGDVPGPGPSTSEPERRVASNEPAGAPAPVAGATPEGEPANPAEAWDPPAATLGPPGAASESEPQSAAETSHRQSLIARVERSIPRTAQEAFHIPGLAAATSSAPRAEAPAEDRPAWLPQLDDRSLDPSVCPFLRAIGNGELVSPVESPDPINRCAALLDAVPQSLRQQELVCLTSGHVSCPRYLRGAAVATEVPAPVVTMSRTLTPAIIGSLAVLVMAFSASVAFVLSRGGMDLTAAAPTLPVPSASAIAGASVQPEPSIAATPVPSATATSTHPTATPTVAPEPTPTPEPTASATPGPVPRSDRYALLSACPDAPRCWIYRVRSGDNLYSIARYFGISQDSIHDRNPWVRTSGLRAGQELRLPPPTR